MYKEFTEAQFLNEINRIWFPKLIQIFRNANREIDNALGEELFMPNFNIMEMDRTWGLWDSVNDELSINQKLLRYYPWEAVEHVMRHEMAHMIVSDIWRADDVSPHGETFKRACNILNIPGDRCDSSTYLMAYGQTDEKVVRKVKKLMALSTSSNVNESTSAMAKAHALMRKHNVKDIYEDDERDIFISRPIGIIGKTVPQYVRSICAILEEFYFVKHIATYHREKSKRGFGYEKFRYVEIFGKPENLDLAEYVFHFLYNQGMSHWEEFKKEAKELGDDIKGTYSKQAYLEDFYLGYGRKLGNEKDKGEVEETETEAEAMNEVLSLAEDKLDDRYKKNYPNLVYRSTRGTTKSGGDGYSSGNKLKFRPGVGRGNRGRSIG
jgi:hypothetical protein